MNNPLEPMDTIEREFRNHRKEGLQWSKAWTQLRSAMIAQNEELASRAHDIDRMLETINELEQIIEQKDARIARLHDALEDTINLCNLTGDEAITRDEDLLRAEKIRDESPRQSHAAVKAEDADPYSHRGKGGVGFPQLGPCVCRVCEQMRRNTRSW